MYVREYVYRSSFQKFMCVCVGMYYVCMNVLCMYVCIVTSLHQDLSICIATSTTTIYHLDIVMHLSGFYMSIIIEVQ